MLEIERPLSISHVFSKQSIFYFIKLSALFSSPLMLYFISNPSLLFLPVFGGEISLCHVFLFLTVFWPLHGEQCCTFYTIHISMDILLLIALTAFVTYLICNQRKKYHVPNSPSNSFSMVPYYCHYPLDVVYKPNTSKRRNATAHSMSPLKKSIWSLEPSNHQGTGPSPWLRDQIQTGAPQALPELMPFNAIY